MRGRMALAGMLLACHAPQATAADVVTVEATAAAAVPVAPRPTFRAIFAAIRAGDWTTARAGIDASQADPLAPVARAELFLAKGAPAADGAAIAALVDAAPDLPQASALVALARRRGAGIATPLPIQRDLVRYAGASKRVAAQPTRADAAANRLAMRAGEAIKANDGAAAEALVEAAAAELSPAGLTEWRARVAWADYLAGDDADARRVAILARGGQGDWATQAAWIEGLAAWRTGDKADAADAFAAVAAQARDPETMAAGLFWSARCTGFASERGAAALRSAARTGETFYGLLAASALGLEPPPLLDLADALVPERPNLRAAVALAGIGETALADRALRYQARIGLPSEHAALIRLAEQIGLPETQVWLAANGPPGGSASFAARYPVPSWSPSGGWRVDRALLLAHALQESRLRLDATSPAGARGLMQLMPGTARLVARHKGDTSGAADRLADPAVSFEYGQSYLEELAANPITNGLLPKVIAAYNAGPNNVALWGLRPGVAADPLLFIESIPFAETRGYVAIVLRNYWMYRRATGGGADDGRAELAAGRWPAFPLASGAVQTARRDQAQDSAAN